jgi:uncharacterized protein (UPF0548 family)
MNDSGVLVETGPLPRWARRSFATLSQRPINFTPMPWSEAIRNPNWHADHRVVSLGMEPPGPPLAGGLYATARQILAKYDVADPAMVRAMYDPSVPLHGRDMLLVGRLFGLRFPMGVRVGGVVDGPDVVDGRYVERFAWDYYTLEGHLERGQMTYEVVKFLDDGTVEFRLAAYSQRGPIRNPVTLLGFVLFGRRLQLRVYTRAIERMLRLTAARAAQT